MKRFLIAAVMCLVLVGIGMLWLTSDNVQPDINVVESGGKTEDHVIAGLHRTPDATNSVQNQKIVSDRTDVNKVRRIIEAANVAINFWGRVVDQDGLPLPAVRIAYTYSIDHGNDQGVAWIEQETRNGETISGDDGSFAITGLTGHYLTLESITKPNYLHRERWPLTYNYYGDTPKGKFEPRREKPVRLTMIHRDATESLVQSKGSLRVSGDGTPGRWNLWEGEPDPNGELAVTLRREPAVLERPGQAATWSADLQIIGGGIIDAPWDEDLRRAPESGYVVTIGYPEAEQKEGVPHRSFYLRTGDGKYGRIQVELDARGEGATARCSITCDMNPRSGSRNLEPVEE